MVIIFSKTLKKKKGVNDVRSKDSERLLCELRTMSRGTTLLSCGTVEADRWFDLAPVCPIRRTPPCQSAASLENLWAVLPEQYQQGNQSWAWDVGNATAITSLIRDLSLGDGKQGRPHTSYTTPTTKATNPTPTAPPSKRQCRSLSFSDEYEGFRSSWRPQGSRIWQAVEKRRCHSGGSVRGGGGASLGGHFPSLQRSSSFNLPSHASVLADGALELPCFTQMPFRPLFTASPTSPSSNQHHFLPQHSLRPLSLSHEQISLLERRREENEEEEDEGQRQAASEASSPDSTPELGRRCGLRSGGSGGLSRSSSQPCVLNDKKIGMKRRRPEDSQEQRPSLDLAKMTQKLQSCLSCPGIPAADGCQSSLTTPSSNITSQSDSEFTSISHPRMDSWQEMTGDDEDDEDSSYGELDSDSECSADSQPRSPTDVLVDKRTLWKGDCGARTDIFQLGGELDLDQIERN